MRGLYGLTFIAIVLFGTWSCGTKGTSPDSLFTLLDPEDAGISFSNDITESESLNILEYEYIYNGGGVALADFDNDGLADVFFTGNMVDNALYRNTGSMNFEDISESAGILGEGRWCSGASVVDINQDGLMDIYVSVGTPLNHDLRANLLYINVSAGDEIRFEERAAEYGIADTSYSVNAAFFDYDNDKDLDLFVITNQMQDKPQSVPVFIFKEE